MEISSPRFFPLHKIVDRIRELLAPAMSKRFWLKAEISSARERGGAFYCDLVETDEQGKILAQMRCNIWVGDFYKMRNKFREAGLDLKLENGTLVGLECRLQHHPVYGLSLNAVDIDPSLALGELELKKRKIIEQLKKEKLNELNCKIRPALLSNRIGLITSVGSAAYNDFVETLHHSAYGFQIATADASVQGEATEKNILFALDVLERKRLDIIVIIRGGGSKTDLAWLDNEAIARRIASYSKPVWTGIGHEIDTSVLDYVAGSFFKTPTAAAEELINRLDAIQHQIEDAEQHLKTSWSYRFKNEREHIDDAQRGLVRGSKKLLEYTKSESMRRRQELRAKSTEFIYSHRNHLNTTAQRISSEVRHRLKSHIQSLGYSKKELKNKTQSTLKQHQFNLKNKKSNWQAERFLRRLKSEHLLLDQKQRALKAVDPQKVLNRGYILLKDEKKKNIKSIKNVSKGMAFEATMADGTFSGTVDTIKKN